MDTKTKKAVVIGPVSKCHLSSAHLYHTLRRYFAAAAVTVGAGIGTGYSYAAVYNGPRFADDEIGYVVTTCDKSGHVAGIKVKIKGAFNSALLEPALQTMWDGIVQDMTPEDLAGNGPQGTLPFELQTMLSPRLSHAGAAMELRRARAEGDGSNIFVIGRPYFTGQPCTPATR